MKFLFIFIFIYFYLQSDAKFVYPDFSKCYTKVSNSFIYKKEIKASPYDENYYISLQQHNSNLCDLYDSFTKVCLIKQKSKNYLRKCNPSKVSDFLATIDSNKIFISNFAQKHSMLNDFNRLNDSFENGVVVNECCEFVGIGSNKDKFIPIRYIEHLKNKKAGIYTTLGFSVKEEHGKVLVDRILANDVALRVGDEIVAIDGVEINSVYEFNTHSLFLKTNKLYSIECIGNKSSLVKARLLYDKKVMYIDSLKVWINKNLEVIKTNTYERKVGDKLIQIDGKNIQSLNELVGFKTKTSIYTFLKDMKQNKIENIKASKKLYWVEKKK